MKNALALAMFSRRPLTHQAAREQLDFLSNFEEGLLRPDICSEYEPVRTPFDQQDLAGPISWLSKPHGALLYKKGKPAIVTGEIWNLTHSADAKAPSPLFCSRWTGSFDGSWSRRIGEDKLEAFVGQLLHVTGSDFGLLTLESDFKAKNTSATSFSYKGLDLAEGLPGLYCSNFLNKELARWLQLEDLPQELALVEEFEGGSILLKFSDSLDDARNTDVLRRQSDAIIWMGRDKFFNIHNPDRKLLTPDWNLASPGKL